MQPLMPMNYADANWRRSMQLETPMQLEMLMQPPMPMQLETPMQLGDADATG